MGLAALGAVLALPTWVAGDVVDPALGPHRAALPGTVVAPAVLGLSLAAGAAGLAGALTGRFARVVAAVVALGCGIGIVWATALVLRDPGAALARGAAGSVGRADAAGVTGAVAAPAAYAAAVVGALLVVAGLVLAFAVRGPSGLSSRYEAPVGAATVGGPAGPHGRTDADDEGARTGRPAEAPAAGDPAVGRVPREGEDAPRSRRDSAVTDWDRLSRGDDPTA